MKRLKIYDAPEEIAIVSETGYEVRNSFHIPENSVAYIRKDVLLEHLEMLKDIEFKGGSLKKAISSLEEYYLNEYYKEHWS